MKRRNVLHSPKLSELKRRRRRVFLRKITVITLAAAVVISLAAYLSRLSGINIAAVEVAGASIVSPEAIRELAQAEMAGAYAWIFPRTNVLVYPKTRIARKLSREFRRLDEINLSVRGNRTLEISVTEREPAYLWCETLDAARCYFMDRGGFVFDEAPHFSGDAYFRWSGTPGMDPAEPRGSRYAPLYFAGLATFREGVEALGLEPVALKLTPENDAELMLKKTGVRDPKIILRPTDDAEHLLENLGAALETEPLKSRLKKEYGRLEYLDLRFENKVYSKFATP